MKKPLCPFIKKPCLEHDCMLYTQVHMQSDPQTGRARDEWACSLALIPVMVLEGARQTRGVQASVESMRNEVVARQDMLNRAVALAQSGRQAGRIVDEPTAQIGDLVKEEKNGR